MPFTDMLCSCQPIQLYLVLIMSIFYFIVQLALSHITHALTLLMAAYHMLCNILALTGCILTIKHSKKHDANNLEEYITSAYAGSNSYLPNVSNKDKIIVVHMGGSESPSATRRRREMKLRNTFGWTRIDILTMLIVFIILASLSFSLIVEALQTLIHIDHQDTMHLPVIVMVLGFVGFVLNGLTYLLIGGYTMHQGSFLHVTSNGDVVLDRVLSTSVELKADERQLSKPSKENNESDQQLKHDLKADIGELHYVPRRQGAVEMLRDVSSTIFVIVCGLIVNMAEDEDHTAKFIDPVLSIFSCVLLVSLSYPYMKQSCLILLQTIPGSIDMEDFERTLVIKFPEIVSYHDLHIWQLTAHKSVATVHIMFQNPQLYTKVSNNIRAYFHDRGITEVTVQPEFQCPKSPSLECLMQCSTRDCADKVCCRDSRTDLREVVSSCTGGNAAHAHKHSDCAGKAEKKQQLTLQTMETDNQLDRAQVQEATKVAETTGMAQQNYTERPKENDGTTTTGHTEYPGNAAPAIGATVEINIKEKSEKSTDNTVMKVSIANDAEKSS